MLMIEARIGELLPSPGQAVIGEGAVRVQGSGARDQTHGYYNAARGI